MMNLHQQPIRQFAQPIWENQSFPLEHEHRHGKMAWRLAESETCPLLQEKVTGHIKSIIAPDEPFDPNPKPEVDPAPPEPEPATRPNIPVEPVGPKNTFLLS